MLKKKIDYIDFDGNERSENFYFNLTKAEVTEMEMGTDGGLSQTLQKIVDERDSKRIIESFKELILKSYGEKSPDGKRFMKNQEIKDSFAQTEAYSVMFMELATNAESAAAFVNGIVPTMKTNLKPMKKELEPKEN